MTEKKIKKRERNPSYQFSDRVKRKKSHEKKIPGSKEKEKYNIYYSLSKAASLAGIAYRTAWTYTQEDPIDPRITKCMRFPEQTHKKKQVLYTQDIIRILQKKRDEGLKRRGTTGRRWKWTKEARLARVELHKKGVYKGVIDYSKRKPKLSIPKRVMEQERLEKLKQEKDDGSD